MEDKKVLKEQKKQEKIRIKEEKKRQKENLRKARPKLTKEAKTKRLIVIVVATILLLALTIPSLIGIIEVLKG